MPTDANAALYRLLTWLSPAYPVGSFTYSQGLETAIAQKRVYDRKSLIDWLEDVATGGAIRADAVIFARAYDAALRRRWSHLADIAAFAIAFLPARELRDETLAQGDAFLQATRAAWPCDTLDRVQVDIGDRCPYPVAVAAAAAGHGIALEDAVFAFVHAMTANLVSVAVRLVPLGQTDGQRALAALEPILSDMAERTRGIQLDDLATNCLLADMMAMQHETLETRLFRS